MSSRLMGMKFMQRAQSKDSLKSTPQKHPDERPAKRRRTTDGTNGTDSDSSFLATPSAMDLEREKLIERQAEEAGDTKWTLENTPFKIPTKPRPGLRVNFAGYGAIDNSAQNSSSEDEGEIPAQALNGRKKFGPQKPEEQQTALRTQSMQRGMQRSRSDQSKQQKKQERQSSSHDQGTSSSSGSEAAARPPAHRQTIKKQPESLASLKDSRVLSGKKWDRVKQKEPPPLRAGALYSTTRRDEDDIYGRVETISGASGYKKRRR